MDFINEFDAALKNGYIKAYYQPIIRTITSSACCAEALARWEDPKKGIIYPNEFIKLLEDNKLIYKLDLAMVENVCKFYNEHQDKNLCFSINLSRLDFEIIDMFDAVTNILKKYEVPTNVIRLEITESIMAYNLDMTSKLFEKFHEAGFEIWIDDFGSGFSSLQLLRDYNFDVLKLDMSLINKFDLGSKKIISSVINMAKTLGMHTLAEGIETVDEVNFLKNVGCEMIQGYYYSKPLSEYDYFKFLESNQIETKSEYDYWSSAGLLNFLSADPLKSISYNNDISSEISPIALIEYEKGIIKYIYVNNQYDKELKDIGYDTVEKLERYVNDFNYEYHKMYINQIERAIEHNDIQRIDVIVNEVVCSHFIKLIAKNNDKFLIASSFYSINSKRTDYLVLKYSQALYKTYDCVTEINPSKDSAIQIYSTAGFAKIYGTVSLKKGVEEFAEKEVHPDDKKRYLEFFDLNTLVDRIKTHIQDSFLIRSNDKYVVKNVRISKLENGKYLYTIQSK